MQPLREIRSTAVLFDTLVVEHITTVKDLQIVYRAFFESAVKHFNARVGEKSEYRTATADELELIRTTGMRMKSDCVVMLAREIQSRGHIPAKSILSCWSDPYVTRGPTGRVFELVVVLQFMD